MSHSSPEDINEFEPSARKDPRILVEALEKIIRMIEVEYSDRFGDESGAKGTACWRTAKSALEAFGDPASDMTTLEWEPSKEHEGILTSEYNEFLKCVIETDGDGFWAFLEVHLTPSKMRCLFKPEFKDIDEAKAWCIGSIQGILTQKKKK